jgi:transposase
MITPETRVQIRRYFYAEHWKIGTIAQALNVHPDTVRRAIEVERFQHAEPLRPSLVDPYLPFVREMLEQYPRLRSTRLYQMIRDRGYSGSVEQLRRTVARLRPQPQEAFLRWQVFPAEQAQVDWAYFGSVTVGRAKRQLSCFVMTLSWSRALYLEFFFDQTTENFLRGHVRAFQDWSGAPRVILYDNLKSAVLERRGNRIHFNPRLLELAADYHFAPRPCQVRAGNQRVAWSEPFGMCAIPSGRDAPLPPWRNAIVRRWRGATKWRTSAAGPTIAHAPWLRLSPKNSRACCRCRSTPSTPIASSRCAPARPSTCISISTTTPSPRKPAT